MTHTHHNVNPGYRKGTVITDEGEILIPPPDWSFLPAGDAAITRAVKTLGPTWVVQVRRGKRTISKGIWANAENIAKASEKVQKNRLQPEYQKQRKRKLALKEKKEKRYREEFLRHILIFLDFHQRYSREAELLARKITDHATPVGSGTVARTQRIPILKRAEAATIAWLRHQTTGYETMHIARIKGNRRKIRQELARQSVSLLSNYRQGIEVSTSCPLIHILRKDSNP